MTYSYTDYVNVYKNIDPNIDQDVDLYTNIDFNKDFDATVYVSSDADIHDNVTNVTVDAEAIGENTLVEIDMSVLTTDDLSSAFVSVISAVDDGWSW